MEKEIKNHPDLEIATHTLNSILRHFRTLLDTKLYTGPGFYIELNKNLINERKEQ